MSDWPSLVILKSGLDASPIQIELILKSHVTCVMQEDELDEYIEYLLSSGLWKLKIIQSNLTVMLNNTAVSLAWNNFEKSDHFLALRNEVI